MRRKKLPVTKNGTRALSQLDVDELSSFSSEHFHGCGFTYMEEMEPRMPETMTFLIQIFISSINR